MKYTGRITLLFISISVSILECMFGLDIENGEIFFDIAIAVIAWGVGWSLDKMIFLSNKDHLTGLYNRRFIDKIMPKLISRARVRDQQICLFNIDINNFKGLNDTYGHNSGDTALKLLANILLVNTRKSDVVARWGGDEFLIIAPDIDKSNAEIIIQRIYEAVDKKLKNSSKDIVNLKLGISVGVASCPEDAKTFDELLSIADKKMYNLKVLQNKIWI
jgi:diguanylate cyclase (GGDEF)-like protein